MRNVSYTKDIHKGRNFLSFFGLNEGNADTQSMSYLRKDWLHYHVTSYWSFLAKHHFLFADRLTKDLLLLQRNGINANNESNHLKDKLSKSESEILQIKMKLNECENNYNKLKRDNNIKVR